MLSWLEPSLYSSKSGLFITVIILGSAVWYAISAVIAWHRLRQFPGPMAASFSYLWGFFAMKTARMNNILAEEQRKHGKVMRIGPNELVVYDPDILWQINGVRSTYDRGDWYASIKFDPYGNSVLSERDTAKHDKRKAQIGAAYAGKGNVNLEKKVDSQLSILINILKTKYLKHGGAGIVDFSQLIRYFQVDLVTLVGSGEPWGDLVHEKDHFDFISIADSIVPFLHCMMMIPLFRDFFASQFFLSLAGPKETDEKGMGKFLG